MGGGGSGIDPLEMRILSCRKSVALLADDILALYGALAIREGRPSLPPGLPNCAFPPLVVTDPLVPTSTPRTRCSPSAPVRLVPRPPVFRPSPSPGPLCPSMRAATGPQIPVRGVVPSARVRAPPTFGLRAATRVPPRVCCGASSWPSRAPNAVRARGELLIEVLQPWLLSAVGLEVGGELPWGTRLAVLGHVVEYA